MSRSRFSRREVLRSIGLTMAIPILQACAPAAQPTQAPSQPAAQPTAAPPKAEAKPTTAPAAKPAAGSAGKTRLRFSTWLGAAKELLAKYNQTYDKAEVAYEEIPFAQFADKILIDMASGTAPDVVHWPSPWWIPSMRKKVFQPLDELLKRDKVDMSRFAYPPEKVTQFEGKLWGMPYALPTTRIVVYNKRMFKEAGLKEPTDEWTWDDKTEAAKKLHKPPTAFAMVARQHMQNIESMILGHGGGVISDDGKKCLLDKPESIEAVQASVDWYLKHKCTMEPGDEKSLGEEPFASDKLAMGLISIPGWSPWKRSTRDLAIDAWVTQFPVSPKTKKRRTGSEAHTEAIYGKTKQLDETWKFFLWSQTDDDAMRYWIDFYPVNYQFEKHIEKITDPVQKKINSLRYDYKSTMEVVYWGPNTSESQKAFNAEYDLALLGKKPVADAMKDATKAIDNIIKDA